MSIFRQLTRQGERLRSTADCLTPSEEGLAIAKQSIVISREVIRTIQDQVQSLGLQVLANHLETLNGDMHWTIVNWDLFVNEQARFYLEQAAAHTLSIADWVDRGIKIEPGDYP